MHVFTVGSLIHSDESRAIRTRNADDKYTEYNACTVFVVGRRSNRSSNIGRTRYASWTFQIECRFARVICFRSNSFRIISPIRPYRAQAPERTTRALNKPTIKKTKPSILYVLNRTFCRGRGRNYGRAMWTTVVYRSHTNGCFSVWRIRIKQRRKENTKAPVVSGRTPNYSSYSKLFGRRPPSRLRSSRLSTAFG